MAFASSRGKSVSPLVLPCGLRNVLSLGGFIDFSASPPLCLVFLELGVEVSSLRLRFAPGESFCLAITSVTGSLRERDDHNQVTSKDEVASINRRK